MKLVLESFVLRGDCNIRNTRKLSKLCAITVHRTEWTDFPELSALCRKETRDLGRVSR